MHLRAKSSTCRGNLSHMLQSCYEQGKWWDNPPLYMGGGTPCHAMPSHRLLQSSQAHTADTTHRPSISIHISGKPPAPPLPPPRPVAPADQCGSVHGTPTSGHKKRPARTRRLAGPERADSHSPPDTCQTVIASSMNAASTSMPSRIATASASAVSSAVMVPSRWSAPSVPADQSAVAT